MSSNYKIFCACDHCGKSAETSYTTRPPDGWFEIKVTEYPDQSYWTITVCRDCLNLLQKKDEVEGKKGAGLLGWFRTYLKG